MGLAAILFISFVALFSYLPQWSGHHSSLAEQEAAERRLFVDSGRWSYYYQRPARKAVIVDSDGQAHRTADGMQMTRRDRGRRIERETREETFRAPAPAPAPMAAPAPEEPPPVYVTRTESGPEAPRHVLDEGVMPESTPAPVPAAAAAEPPMVPPASPLAPEAPTVVVPDASTAPPPAAPQAVPQETVERVYQKLLHDETMTEATKSTLQVTAEGQGIALRGIVYSEYDKRRMGLLAEESADGASVDNRLEVRP